MLEQLVFLASEAHESSKTLFYVLGSLAAVYAVVLAAIGIKKPDFPASESAAKGVYAVSSIVVIVAMASAVITS